MPINKNKRNEMKENSAHKMSKIIKKNGNKNKHKPKYYILYTIFNLEPSYARLKVMLFADSHLIVSKSVTLALAYTQLFWFCFWVFDYICIIINVLYLNEYINDGVMMNWSINKHTHNKHKQKKKPFQNQTRTLNGSHTRRCLPHCKMISGFHSYLSTHTHNTQSHLPLTHTKCMAVQRQHRKTMSNK